MDELPIQKTYTESLSPDIIGVLPGLNSGEKVKIGYGIYEYKGANHRIGDRTQLIFEFVKLVDGTS